MNRVQAATALLASAALFTLAGCANDGWKVNRVDPTKPTEVDYHFSDEDARQIFQELSQDMLSLPWAEAFMREHGVRVVVAHCASVGDDVDLDRGANGPRLESFALFARLMDEPRNAGLLYGDISAVTQVNRSAAALRRIIERSDWHPRLLNGSDYPLPGVMPLISVSRMVDLGFIESAAAPVLMEIRSHNPLLFDFVLKRHLRAGGKRLAPVAFETRTFFQPAVSQPSDSAANANSGSPRALAYHRGRSHAAGAPAAPGAMAA